MSNIPTEELMEILKPQGVTKIERMTRRFEGETIPTNRYILDFNKTDLPPLISLTDWHHEIVEQYIPRPMQCTNCRNFGHTKKWCRKETEVCLNCGQPGHKAASCDNDTCCANCGKDHPANDRNCEVFKFRSEILATQARQHITFQEARETVQRRYHESGMTYSFATKRNIKKTPNSEETNDTGPSKVWNSQTNPQHQRNKSSTQMDPQQRMPNPPEAQPTEMELDLNNNTETNYEKRPNIFLNKEKTNKENPNNTPKKRIVGYDSDDDVDYPPDNPGATKKSKNQENDSNTQPRPNLYLPSLPPGGKIPAAGNGGGPPQGNPPLDKRKVLPVGRGNPRPPNK